MEASGLFGRRSWVRSEDRELGHWQGILSLWLSARFLPGTAASERLQSG
jgi:hypothetical protein